METTNQFTNDSLVKLTTSLLYEFDNIVSNEIQEDEFYERMAIEICETRKYNYLNIINYLDSVFSYVSKEYLSITNNKIMFKIN